MITNRTGPVCDSAENTGMEGEFETEEFDTEDRPNPRDIVAYSHQRVLCFAAQQRRLQLMQGSNACLTWAKDKAVIPAVYIGALYRLSAMTSAPRGEVPGYRENGGPGQSGELGRARSSNVR